MCQLRFASPTPWQAKIIFNRSRPGRRSVVLSAYSVSLLLMLVVIGHPPSLAAQSAAPLVLYTDVLSGPNSGGENNDGTYLSIFGQNFGTSGLGTSTRVFIGGAEVASYRYLGSSAGRPDVQQITVQVGG